MSIRSRTVCKTRASFKSLKTRWISPSLHSSKASITRISRGRTISSFSFDKGLRISCFHWSCRLSSMIPSWYDISSRNRFLSSCHLSNCTVIVVSILSWFISIIRPFRSSSGRIDWCPKQVLPLGADRYYLVGSLSAAVAVLDGGLDLLFNNLLLLGGLDGKEGHEAFFLSEMMI